MEAKKLHERLEVVQEKFRYSKKDMAEVMGLKPRSFYTAKTKGRPLSMSAIMMLVKEIPALNLNWLLRGEGEMILDAGPGIVREKDLTYEKSEGPDPVIERLDRIESKLDQIIEKGE